MKRPIFSFITPVYNGAKVVDRCYYSLSKQTYSDWEWIIVNDGSIDGTSDIINKIDDKRIRLISYEKNKGRGNARNLALANCKGEWIVNQDMDDMSFPDRLEKINNARLNGYHFFCSYVLLLDNLLNIKGIRGFYFKPILGKTYCVHASIACSLDIAKKINYSRKMKVGEDLSFIYTLCDKYRGQYANDVLYIYNEDYDVNIQKTISANINYMAQLRLLFHNRHTSNHTKQYIYDYIKCCIRLNLLNLFQYYPELYVKTVALRSKGDTKNKDVPLYEERLRFIKDIKILSKLP